MTPDPPPTFPRPSLDDWHAEAERVLRGKPLSSVTWTTEDGIEVPPVVPEPPPCAPVPVRAGEAEIIATVESGHDAAFALETGFDAVRICYDHDEQADELSELDLSRVLLDPIEAVSATAALRDLPDAAGVVLGWWGWTHVVEGTTPAQQIAWMLSAAVDVLTEADEGDAARLVLEIPVGAEVLTEVAKLRALRVLWAEIADERDLPSDLRVLATGPAFPYARYDAESNLLRASLAGFAALSGGADYVELSPYRADGQDADEGVRLALGQFRLMREESNLHTVDDPFAGAGVIELLTAELGRIARVEFDRLRKLGGFLAMEQDWNEERLEALTAPHEEPQAARADAIARRERVVVGINQFADPAGDDRVALTEDPDAAFGTWSEEGVSLTEWSADGVREFEYLRERMRWHAARVGGPTEAVLLPLGPVGWRRARADFAADFFRAGGFAIDDPQGLDSVDAAVAHAQDRSARLVVVCSDDASYGELVPAVVAALPDTLVFVAGRTTGGADEWGATGFVHQGANAVEILTEVQDALGLRRLP